MLELLTTDAFAAWFSALEAAPAEDVAATLEVITQLGTGKEAPGSSEWLLWYEHPSLAARPLPDLSKVVPAEILKFSQDWGAFLGYVKRVTKHLESKAFAARLSRLGASEAARVADALSRIRGVAKTRTLTMFGAYTKYNRWKSPAHLGALMRFADVDEVRAAYFEALAAAGFDVADVPPHSAALREITLRSTAPGLRLLYGIDEPRNRGLVVLGEWLDRSFYGDSVRHAEAVWRDFVEGRPLPARAVAP